MICDIDVPSQSSLSKSIPPPTFGLNFLLSETLAATSREHTGNYIMWPEDSIREPLEIFLLPEEMTDI